MNWAASRHSASSVVGQVVEEASGVVASPEGRLDIAHERIDERAEREAGGGVRGTPLAAAQLLGAAAPVPDRLHVTTMEGVHRERDDERKLLRVRVAGQIGERGLQTRVRGVEAPTQMLESRSGHGQPDALADLGQCERRDRGLQGVHRHPRAVPLPPARRRVTTAARAGGRRASGEQPQRVLVPACGGGGRPGAHARCRARQDRDGVLVPGVRRDGDVMRVGLGRRAALEQRRRRPGVRREPPAGARRVVDRAAHEGVAHREAPRLRGRSHEACGHEASSASRASPSATPATVATVSGSKSTPTIAAASRTVRTSGVSAPRSSASAADTACGTPGSSTSPEARATGAPSSRLRARCSR